MISAAGTCAHSIYKVISMLHLEAYGLTQLKPLSILGLLATMSSFLVLGGGSLTNKFNYYYYLRLCL